ncbi:AraC family transcriptional regulator [Butyrivibrio sp. AE3004]|uniref:AraC family transcriptional regulator n=1 Tax=Butyrivibrio sp. AE3004 TaxID=1506994 RepID=UPI0004946AE1|nr:AraC family transcriptional regulator [Butyrivibrio sp. AE3004]
MKTSSNGLGFDFCAFLDYDKSAEVRIYEIGNYKCEPGYSYGPVLRPRGILHFVISGKGKLQIMGKEYHIHANQLFYIPANIMAYYEADKDDPWEYCWTHIGGAVMLEALKDCQIDEYNPVKDIISSKTGNFRNLFDILSDIFNDYESEYYCLAKVYEIMDYLKKAYLTATEKNNESQQLQYVRTVIKFIQLKYSENIHVDTIADTCGLNRSYLSRLFRDATGTTIKDYIQTYRMQTAQKMLKNSDSSIQYIAFAVGYNDIFTFSKAFKKYSGFSPSSYRNQPAAT